MFTGISPPPDTRNINPGPNEYNTAGDMSRGQGKSMSGWYTLTNREQRPGPDEYILRHTFNGKVPGAPKHR